MAFFGKIAYKRNLGTKEAPNVVDGAGSAIAFEAKDPTVKACADAVEVVLRQRIGDKYDALSEKAQEASGGLPPIFSDIDSFIAAQVAAVVDALDGKVVARNALMKADGVAELRESTDEDLI